MVITRAAPAKINLNLRVVGRRRDGLHLLDSLVVFADFGDVIQVAPSDRLTLTLSGPFADGLPTGSDNLVLKAADALQAHLAPADIGRGAAITLIKHLPPAAGIGGGSADAAATLKALTTLWDSSDSGLDQLALFLGADVPVCMQNRPSRMRGIGEIIEPLDITFPLFLVLVNPGVALSTAEIFTARAARKAAFSEAGVWPSVIANLPQLIEILCHSGNDLAMDACMAAPEITAVLTALTRQKSCLYAAMSGSGATCYGLFPDQTTAQAAATSLAWAHKNWWIQEIRANMPAPT